jgi:predicted RND superfamily exporter protein
MARSLSWAKQIAAQAEGMFLAARQNGDKDPVGWAVGYLAQGVEPRAVRVTKLQVEPASSASERFELDLKNHIFDYSKLLIPETGTGVRIQIQVGYFGFLGARHRIASDLSVILVFSLFLALSYFLMNSFVLRRRPRWNSKSELKEEVLRRIEQAKKLTVELGLKIRDLVKSAKNLAVASGRTSAAAAQLGERLKQDHHKFNQLSKILKQLDQVGTGMEVLSLNTLMASTRQMENANQEELARLMTELHENIQQTRAMIKKCESLIDGSEQRLGASIQDAEAIAQSYEEIKQITEDLNEQISQTTETLLGQSTMIRELGQRRA